MLTNPANSSVSWNGVAASTKQYTAPIIREIIKEYVLPLRGYHGVVHWSRVLENGLRLAESTGANQTVVTLFALFHDARRENEGIDDEHGQRGGELARRLRGVLFQASDAEIDILYEACRLHTSGLVHGDVTLQTCWDADRLDLGRVGITPSAHKLCTDAARSLIPWANERARRDFQPDLLRCWGV